MHHLGGYEGPAVSRSPHQAHQRLPLGGAPEGVRRFGEGFFSQNTGRRMSWLDCGVAGVVCFFVLILFLPNQRAHTCGSGSGRVSDRRCVSNSLLFTPGDPLVFLLLLVSGRSLGGYLFYINRILPYSARIGGYPYSNFIFYYFLLVWSNSAL